MKKPLPFPTERVSGRRCGVDDCLEIRPTKSRGWGLFAVADIPAGTVVVRETPLAVIRTLKLTVKDQEALNEKLATIGPLGNTEKTLTESLGDQLLNLGVNRLWLRPFSSKVPKRVTVRDLAIAVASANGIALATKFTATVFAFGLYDVGSLFNHSCEPSVINFPVGDTTADMVFRTQIALSAGSELTVTYLVGLDEVPHLDSRQASTKLHYGFLCRCHRCEREGREDSPAARKRG